MTVMLERGLGAFGVTRGASWMGSGQQLDRLVAEEAYEEAARLRDKISKMENGGSDSS